MRSPFTAANAPFDVAGRSVSVPESSKTPTGGGVADLLRRFSLIEVTPFAVRTAPLAVFTSVSNVGIERSVLAVALLRFSLVYARRMPGPISACFFSSFSPWPSMVVPLLAKLSSSIGQNLMMPRSEVTLRMSAKND